MQAPRCGILQDERFCNRNLLDATQYGIFALIENGFSSFPPRPIEVVFHPLTSSSAGFFMTLTLRHLLSGGTLLLHGLIDRSVPNSFSQFFQLADGMPLPEYLGLALFFYRHHQQNFVRPAGNRKDVARYAFSRRFTGFADQYSRNGGGAFILRGGGQWEERHQKKNDSLHVDEDEKDHWPVAMTAGMSKRTRPGQATN
jgi:hypothetical protein